MKLLEAESAGYYDPVPCPLALCGEPLHLTYTADQLLYASFTEEDLDGIIPADLPSWEVRCEAGHVILLPPDDGQDNHTFGTCSCDPADVKDHGHDDGCAHGDFARLKEVIAMARTCPNCGGTGKVTSGTRKTVDCPFCHGTGRR
jgi:hypothetical protein